MRSTMRAPTSSPNSGSPTEKPGFYLLVGPIGTATCRPASGGHPCPTSLANAIPRVFMDDTDQDRAAIQSVIDQIVFYPLSRLRRHDEDQGLERGAEHSRTEAPRAAVRPSGWCPRNSSTSSPRFWTRVAPLPGEEALYAQFRSLLAVAARDPAIKKAIVADGRGDRGRGDRAVPRVASTTAARRETAGTDP